MIRQANNSLAYLAASSCNWPGGALARDGRGWDLEGKGIFWNREISEICRLIFLFFFGWTVVRLFCVLWL